MAGSDDPYDTSTLSPVRQKVAELFGQIPVDRDVNSNGDTAGLFEQLTGWNQAKLDAKWKDEDAARATARADGKSEKQISLMPNTTTCNEFVIRVGHAIKSPIALGQFYIDNVLQKAGFEEAWVPAGSGERPGLGDPFVVTSRGHMGVSDKFIGDQWYTIESGQGGHKVGHDIIKRKQTQWDPSKLLGWVNIDKLMQLAQPAPDWLTGWWVIDFGGTQAWLYVGDHPKCPCFAKKPLNMSGKPIGWTPWDATVHMNEDGQSATIDFGSGGGTGTGGLVKNVQANGPNAIAGTKDGGVKVTGTRPG
ncbi:MAG: hypothetical protein P4L82_02285 [Ancalomicrobiaceae bacterium]|nr:hypothetical protein [Ancalomicrobiaceae bacterium]